MDRLENEAGERLDVIRLNIQEPVGKEMAKNYGFQYTPTFIFFDENGEEIWRQVGGLDAEHVLESLPK